MTAQIELGPNDAVLKNAFHVIAVIDEGCGDWGLVLQTVDGSTMTADRAMALATVRGCRAEFEREYRSKGAAMRAARRLLADNLNRPLGRAA